MCSSPASSGGSSISISPQLNANIVTSCLLEGKRFAIAFPGWANQIISAAGRFRAHALLGGLPSVIQGNYTWTTNYWQNSLAIPDRGVQRHIGTDQLGESEPVSRIPAASDSFAMRIPGQTGAPSDPALAPMKTFDLAVAKSWSSLGRPSHPFRAEAYNAFNLGDFINPGLALYNPPTFANSKAPRRRANCSSPSAYEF